MRQAGILTKKNGNSGPDFFTDDEPLAFATAGRTPEQRLTPRYALVLRAARLVADGRELVCVLRDISATGVRIKLFHPLPACARLQLDLEGVLHAMTLAWVSDDHAGLHFADPLSSSVTPASGYPRRPLRIRVDRPVALAVRDQTPAARLVDLSQQGACIETEAPLLLRERLRIVHDRMPEMRATVCWRRPPRNGLVFAEGFTLDELARLVERLSRAGGRGGG